MTEPDEFRNITRRLYAVISQTAGKRDWESARHLYHPRATMVRTGIGDDVRRGRGVNFFNFVNEGEGWKIMNIIWDNERDGVSMQDAGLLPANE